MSEPLYVIVLQRDKPLVPGGPTVIRSQPAHWKSVLGLVRHALSLVRDDGWPWVPVRVERYR